MNFLKNNSFHSSFSLNKKKHFTSSFNLFATMASSAKTTKESTKNTKDAKKSQGLPLVDKILGPNNVGNQQYVPEPLIEEQRRIFQSQVLILIYISSKTHVMLGPLLNLNVDHSKLKEFFPNYHRYKPIACAKKT